MRRLAIRRVFLVGSGEDLMTHKLEDVHVLTFEHLPEGAGDADPDRAYIGPIFTTQGAKAYAKYLDGKYDTPHQ
jgi:hypothetical protein